MWNSKKAKYQCVPPSSYGTDAIAGILQIFLFISNKLKKIVLTDKKIRRCNRLNVRVFKIYRIRNKSFVKRFLFCYKYYTAIRALLIYSYCVNELLIRAIRLNTYTIYSQSIYYVT